MKTNYPIFLVGGAVRDQIMGLPQPKDLDFVMLAPSFEAMECEVLRLGCKIYVSKPEFLTMRVNHPEFGSVDFACARKDGAYHDGRRPSSTEIAETLEQDLSRRDFTINAMAIDLSNDKLIDPFNGTKDITYRLIRPVGSARARLDEDKLRAFRAVRFAVTKSMHLIYELDEAINSLTPLSFGAVSTERIREELLKAFSVDWNRTFSILMKMRVLMDVIEERGIWFRPTTETK